MTQSSATQRGSQQADAQFNIDRTHPSRWTITFSNPPINILIREEAMDKTDDGFDATTFAQ